MVNLVPGNTTQIVWLIGVGTTVAALVSWLLPKVSKPHIVVAPHPAAAVAPIGAMSTPATGPSAYAQSMGPTRDYNLAGLAIEELDQYPSSAGVMLSGI